MAVNSYKKVIEQVRMAGAVAWLEQGPEKQDLCSFGEGDSCENVLLLIEHFIIFNFSFYMSIAD